MLRSCLPYLGSPDCGDNNMNNDVGVEHSSSFLLSSNNSKHIFVRVVHAGGKIDHYPNAVLASKLLQTLPGKWLTHPQVFKQPHQSIIYPQQYLLPGHKYYVIPLSTIDKLMRKHSSNSTNTFTFPPNNANADAATVGIINQQIHIPTSGPNNVHHPQSMDQDDFSFYSAREFYANKNKRSASSAINGSSGASRRPRIAKPKPCSAYAWEPALTSIQELSP